MSQILLAVFNHSEARFIHGLGGGTISEEPALIFPASRARAQDMESDKPSRVQDSFGARHAYSPHSTAHEKQSREFARTIAQSLESARLDHAFTHLVLVAPPDMTGAVKKALTKECKKLVVAEHHKNLAALKIDDVFAALPESIKILGKRRLGLPGE